MDGRMDGRTDANSVPEMELVSPVEIRSYTYVRSAHIVRRPYVEKNAITPRRIWWQCTGACLRASTSLLPASSLPPCPSSLRPSIERACRMPIVSPPLCRSHSRALAISGHACSSSDSRHPRRFFLYSPRRSAPSCTLKTRSRYPDRRYRMPYPPTIPRFTLSLSFVERPGCDIFESRYV